MNLDVHLGNYSRTYINQHTIEHYLKLIFHSLGLITALINPNRREKVDGI